MKKSKRQPKIVDRASSGIKAAKFIEIWACADPECGPHIVLFDQDDKPFAEFTIRMNQIDDHCLNLVKFRMQAEEIKGRIPPETKQ